MKIFRKLESNVRQNLLILFAAGLLFWSSIASMLPTLPPYIKDMGATTQQLGIVMGCFAIGLLLFRTPLGILADKHSRKLVLIIGTLVAAIAPLCYLIVPLGYLWVNSIALLMLIRVFHGISIAAFTTGYSALVADLSPPQQRGELIGYMSLVAPMGLAVGPMMGSFLQTEAGYPALFLGAGGLGLLSVVFTSVVSEQIRFESEAQETSPPHSKHLLHLLTSPRLRIPVAVLLVVGFAFGTISTFISLFIRETGVDFNAGLFFSATAIINFSTRLFAGRASDLYGRGLFISGGLVCYSCSMFLISTAQTPQGFLLATIAQGIAAGTVLPMMIVLMSDRSTPDERGRVFSVGIGGFDLGIALAGPVFGFFADMLSYRGIFTVTTGLMLLALIVFITQSSKNISHSLRFAIGRERDIYALDRNAQ
ncbi:MAG: MFS transporter [Symploca sp. SIO3C6]|uniref:MFS transporter n=1 Tax=Symploca sp. SIO1C4 TaxID=2607765 RepID=A0A6B3N6R8_9CYAN|nr:MFS transporter [Symploca sp. SIO3C6]NER26312.1 MFS transporter [Symploca sp. SIO1C4]